MGTVYMIPNVIAGGTADQVIAPQVREILPKLKYFLVEDVRTARRYISSLKLGIRIEDLVFEKVDKKTGPAEIGHLMRPVLEGKDVGVISESGCPGVADPGAAVAAFAHGKGIKVVPMVGPSSLLLALMASGFNGQSFAFIGYLPIDKAQRRKRIIAVEKKSEEENQTQIFIETPYRNEALLGALLRNLKPSTKLCIARDVTGEEEFVVTKSVGEWKKSAPELKKVPTVFLVQGQFNKKKG
ncbi:S-adenosylmethionine-dependent methyltransferase [Fulvitalea axinellae]|uniref:S-adenosylmethionine-dependent methyltransferase n=1 Tax=Fulvitalea axinellae TaxID=1182444 RepID=A0AAU9CH68_9BACT|nr:S-adenosylmethionine-dependent methyltransferase [Fulvitalea axinellae]